MGRKRKDAGSVWLGASPPFRAGLIFFGIAAWGGSIAARGVGELESLSAYTNSPGYNIHELAAFTDLLEDYYVEIERFDHDVGDLLEKLRSNGQLENTIVVVTSDNGTPFPRAKTTLYDSGTRMPLAVCWKAKIPGGRTVDDFISFVDIDRSPSKFWMMLNRDRPEVEQLFDRAFLRRPAEELYDLDNGPEGCHPDCTSGNQPVRSFFRRFPIGRRKRYRFNKLRSLLSTSDAVTGESTPR